MPKTALTQLFLELQHVVNVPTEREILLTEALKETYGLLMYATGDIKICKPKLNLEQAAGIAANKIKQVIGDNYAACAIKNTYQKFDT